MSEEGEPNIIEADPPPPESDGDVEPEGPQLSRQLTAGAQWERYGRYPYLLAKVLFFGLLISGLGYMVMELSAVVFPVLASMLLAYLLNPMVGRLQKKGIVRPLGILIILIGLMAFVVVFSWVLYPVMADQVRKIAQRAPQAFQVLQDDALPWVTETLGIAVPGTWAEILEQYGEEIRNAIPNIADRIGDWTGEVVTRTTTILVSIFNLIMIPIFTFYFLRDFEKGKERLHKYVPDFRQELILDRLHQMDLAVGQWFRGQIQVSLILAVLYAIGLGAVYGLTGHGLQNGAVIGLLTGLLNVVPYLGFAVGSVLAFLVVIIDWTGWAAIIGVALAFTVIQTVESYYITPRILGDKVGMKPVVVIIVLLIGGHAAGILGVLLAIPVAGAVKVLLPDVVKWYRESSVYTGVPMEPATAGLFVEASESGEGRRRLEEAVRKHNGDAESHRDEVAEEQEPDQDQQQDQQQEPQGEKTDHKDPSESKEDVDDGDSDSKNPEPDSDGRSKISENNDEK